MLVSLIRGGIPAGILIKRYLERKYKIKISHYAITLIGTKGIDNKALEYILERHDGNNIQFFGSIFLEELISYDRTYQFINCIEEQLNNACGIYMNSNSDVL